MVGIGRPRITVGAHMCLASLPRTDKSLWEHYNELTAKLDEMRLAAWHDMANTTLIFVRLPLSNFPVAKAPVVSSLCGHPLNISRLHFPTVKV